MDVNNPRGRGIAQHWLSNMSESNDKCFQGDCGRRDFLRAGGCFVAALAAIGLPVSLEGLPVVEVNGTGTGNEKRYSLPTSDGVNIDHGTQVILVRFQNSVFAFALACPHEHAAVKWLSKDKRFQCSKHDSQYQPNGTYTTGHATRNLDRFAIRREDAAVFVDLHRWFESDKDPVGWASAVVVIG
jgi:nitrite reductase/ring-hydroxylating ferredoxin subunit